MVLPMDTTTSAPLEVERRSGGLAAIPLIWWPIIALLALLSATVVAVSYVNHDAAWYLYMARKTLQGARVYRDVVDTNPPLIVWLTMVPEWIARAGVPDVALFKAYVSTIALVSLGVSARISTRAWAGVHDHFRGFFVAGLVFAALPFVKSDFGQREHFAVLMTLPYVMSAAAWLRSDLGAWQWRRVLIGATGGLGFALKPHYLLAWFAVECAALALARPRASWRRAEFVGAVGSVALYAVAVAAFVPQYLQLTSTIAAVYGGLNSSSARLLRIPDVQYWMVCAVLLAAVRLPERTRVTSAVLFAAATGFLLAALLQLKGWSYHLYPARVFTLLFLIALAVAVFDALPALARLLRGGMRGVVLAGAVLLLAWSGRYLLEARRPATEDLVAPLADLVRQQAPGGNLAVLSMRTIIYPAFPVVNYTGAGWSLRHNSLWFLPGLYERELEGGVGDVPFRAPDAMPRVERRFFDEIVSDLCSTPPDLLLIEPPVPRAPAGRRALDLSAYYGQDARYRRLSTAYERLTTIGPFTVFKRTSRASCQ
jgi:hypothetical protein